MGLSISHNTFSSSYSTFKHWRLALAKAVGLAQYDVSRFQDIDLDWGSFTEENFLGSWEEYPDDPLIVLIVHADHEGVLYHDINMALAERLKEISSYSDMVKWSGITNRFIEGLLSAYDKGDDLLFY